MAACNILRGNCVNLELVRKPLRSIGARVYSSSWIPQSSANSTTLNSFNKSVLYTSASNTGPSISSSSPSITILGTTGLSKSSLLSSWCYFVPSVPSPLLVPLCRRRTPNAPARPSKCYKPYLCQVTLSGPQVILLSLFLQDVCDGIIELCDTLSDFEDLIHGGVCAYGRSVRLTVEWKWWVEWLDRKVSIHITDTRAERHLIR
ncbi:hypothetical protein EDB19DRAFT_173229 [Suillus lakei]|nr:hypothetical protein EDB19DRAFT_173229 [Suillus lakei]